MPQTMHRLLQKGTNKAIRAEVLFLQYAEAWVRQYLIVSGCVARGKMQNKLPSCQPLTKLTSMCKIACRIAFLCCIYCLFGLPHSTFYFVDTSTINHCFSYEKGNMAAIHPLVGAKCRCSFSMYSSSSACNFRTSPTGVCPSPAFQDGAKAADPPTVAEMVQEGGVTPQFSTETSCWMESCNL